VGYFAYNTTGTSLGGGKNGSGACRLAAISPVWPLPIAQGTVESGWYSWSYGSIANHPSASTLLG
jgi:hypothetical protein